MKASMTALVAVLTIGSVGLMASNALACHGGGYGGGYSSHYYPSTQYVREVYVQAPTFAPAHSLIMVLPGDSWFSICVREYGNSVIWSKVADFNGMPQNLPLTIGMQLRLPVINPNGSLSLSSAPAAFAMAPQGFAGGIPQGLPQGAQFGQQPGSSQANSLTPQSQGFASQQVQMGIPQGSQFGPQAGGPQASQLGQQGQQLAPRAPVAPQAPVADSKHIGIAPQFNDANQTNGMTSGHPGLPNGQAAAPNAAGNVAPSDRPLPSILIGSLMSISGQQLGNERGMVHLNVNSTTRMLEIVEWTASSAKVKVPADLPAGIQAQIEILRADGSVVTKDTVQLVAGQELAAGN